jgi:hypothetical protein
VISYGVSPLFAAWLAITSALALGCKEESTYAPGFTEASFGSVPLGSSEAEVRRILGEPLEQWRQRDSTGNQNRVIWVYSKRSRWEGEYYHVLIFGPEGRVIGRDSEYYLD